MNSSFKRAALWKALPSCNKVLISNRNVVVYCFGYQVNGGGVHGNKFRDFLVVPVAALDNVGGPGLQIVDELPPKYIKSKKKLKTCLVMKAVAAVGALHTTITSEKVTAHAEGKAVRLIGA